MSEFVRPAEVTLREDLTRYHPTLKPGTRGVAPAPPAPGATATERFCRVQFPEVAVDVLWSGLEVTDEEYKARGASLVDARAQAVAVSARGAVRHVGERGGFKKLVVSYSTPEGEARTWVVRGEAERKKCEEMLAKLGVPIMEVIDR